MERCRLSLWVEAGSVRSRSIFLRVVQVATSVSRPSFSYTPRPFRSQRMRRKRSSVLLLLLLLPVPGILQLQQPSTTARACRPELRCFVRVHARCLLPFCASETHVPLLLVRLLPL